MTRNFEVTVKYNEDPREKVPRKLAVESDVRSPDRHRPNHEERYTAQREGCMHGGYSPWTESKINGSSSSLSNTGREKGKGYRDRDDRHRGANLRIKSISGGGWSPSSNVFKVWFVPRTDAIIEIHENLVTTSTTCLASSMVI